VDTVTSAIGDDVSDLGRTVDVIANDINYLADAVSNITECHGQGSFHTGGGKCISAVVLCPAPEAPPKGTVALIGGVGTHDVPL
jgi:hypothetical protein